MRSRYRIAVAVTSLIALAACGKDGPTEPQGGPCNVAAATSTINIGQTITGALSTADCTLPDSTYADIYRITVPTGQTLRIDMTSTAVDAYLVVFNQAGTPIAFDDDGANDGTSNARITRTYTAGTYFIAANSFDPREVGGYSLSVTVSTAAASCELSDATAFTLGQTIAGTLATTDCTFNDGSYFDLYRVTLSAGQVLDITMTSAEFDTYLVLFDAAGTPLAENDDSSGTTTNSRIQQTLAAGTYYVAANGFDSSERGAYSLNIR